MQSQKLRHFKSAMTSLHCFRLNGSLVNITDNVDFIASRVLCCTFMAQYGASFKGNVHKHLQRTWFA